MKIMINSKGNNMDVNIHSFYIKIHKCNYIYMLDVASGKKKKQQRFKLKKIPKAKSWNDWDIKSTYIIV